MHVISHTKGVNSSSSSSELSKVTPNTKKLITNYSILILYSHFFNKTKMQKFEELQSEACRELSDEDMMDINHELLSKERSACTPQELEMIRREVGCCVLCFHT